MQKYVIAALFAACAVTSRIPLTKRPLSKAAFLTYKE